MFDTIGLSRAAVAWSGADSMGDGGHVPPLLQMDGHGGTVSRTANKKLTKLYWPLRKRSPKRLIVLLEPKSGGARPPPPTFAPDRGRHFQIRSGATGSVQFLMEPFSASGRAPATLRQKSLQWLGAAMLSQIVLVLSSSMWMDFDHQRREKWLDCCTENHAMLRASCVRKLSYRPVLVLFDRTENTLSVKPSQCSLMRSAEQLSKWPCKKRDRTRLEICLRVFLHVNL